MHMGRWANIFLQMVLYSMLLSASPIKPLPKEIEVNAKKAALGEKLFHDTILSKDGTVSCATCHDLKTGGDDGQQFSKGVGGKIGKINAPTVYNAVFNFRQFWDGRARDLKAQVFGPIENPVEMDQSKAQTIEKLKKDTAYRLAFAKVYPDGITQENVADAIAEYEKTLITSNAPFDRYLRGEKNAISKEAKEGYGLFKSKGCIVCHNGMNVGGNFYNKFGIFKDTNSSSLGRYNLTHREEDKFVFKVPSLRNVALTAPYMHDGRAKTLQEAIAIMSEHQLGRFMTQEETEKIKHFLESLTGEIPQSVKRLH
jgi:cytochrome c peroxidase